MLSCRNCPSVVLICSVKLIAVVFRCLVRSISVSFLSLQTILEQTRLLGESVDCSPFCLRRMLWLLVVSCVVVCMSLMSLVNCKSFLVNSIHGMHRVLLLFELDKRKLLYRICRFLILSIRNVVFGFHWYIFLLPGICRVRMILQLECLFCRQTSGRLEK